MQHDHDASSHADAETSVNETIHGPKSAATTPQKKRDRETCIIPFIVVSLVTLPSLLVSVFMRQSVSYDTLMISGPFATVVTIMTVAVALGVLFAVLYLWRGTSHAGRAAVVITTMVLVSCLAYLVLPQ